MSDALFSVFFFRGVERWMIVAGGLFFGYMGYKLFLYGVDHGHGKLETENQFFKLTFSGSGPGLFFMAFGAIVLVNSIYSTATGTRESAPTTGSIDAPVMASADNPSASFANKETLSFAGQGVACDMIGFDALDKSPERVLFAYSAVEGSQADAQIQALGAALASVDDRTLRTLLPTIEDVICALE